MTDDNHENKGIHDRESRFVWKKGDVIIIRPDKEVPPATPEVNVPDPSNSPDADPATPVPTKNDDHQDE